MIHLSSVLFVYFLLYFEQKNYVKQYNNIQDEVYLTIPKSKKTHLKTGFWKLEFMEQQAEIAAKRRQITGRFEEKYIHTALTLPNCLDYHHSIPPNEPHGNSIRRTHTQGLVYKRYNHRFKSTVIIISTKYSWNLKYIQIIRYRKKYQLKALKTYKGLLPFYICCYNDHQKTIKPFFAKKYVNLGM